MAVGPYDLIIPGLIVVAVYLIYAKKKIKSAKLKMQNLNNSILGVIGCANDSWRYYALFFTPEGIIVALTWGQLSKFGTLDPNGELESIPIASKLATMSLDNILHADKSNFTIQYAAVSSITVKKGIFISSPHITIITDQQKYEYHFNEQNIEEVIEIVKRACPDKLLIQ